MNKPERFLYTKVYGRRRFYSISARSSSPLLGER